MDVSIFILRILSLLFTIFPQLENYFQDRQAINLSDYDYPKPDDTTDGIYRIALLGTNDIHGAAFSFEFQNPLDGSKYYYGGLEYLANYVKVLREEWKDRFLWLDAGDQFQGKIESKISNGTIITEFFNTMMVNGSSIGNHEWDYGQEFLKDRLEEANWEYLAANIISNQTGKAGFLPNTKKAEIYKMGEINLGVIGLTTIETPFTTSGNLTNIKFAEYREVVIKLSTSLRKKGAHAVVLVSHAGMRCSNDPVEKMILSIRNHLTEQKECEEDEIKVLLDTLDQGVVDAVIAGHVHDVAHHWVNGVPVVQSIDGGYYSHVIYLAFNAATKELIKEKIEIEGPLPTCEKVFENTRKCDFVSKKNAAGSGPLRKFLFHDKIMKADDSLDVVFEKWWQEVKIYKVKISTIDFVCKGGNNEENPCGNLFADIYLKSSNADISITNNGGIRSEWYTGDVLVESVYNMFPFDSKLVTVEMTGKEVKLALSLLQSGKEGFYHTSGVMQDVYISPKKRLINVKLYDGSEIEDDRTYVVATNDFLIDGGDDFKIVREWYTPRNLKNHGLIRDFVISKLKDIRNIQRCMLIDPNRRRLNIISRNSFPFFLQ